MLAAQAGTGETVTFWILAPLAVLASFGMLVVKRAVHSALLLALTMVCLAIFYLAQEAPFLGVVQVVVYTGAIMMLFLFVLMLVGVDSSDSLVETLRGQRVGAVLAALGFVGLLLVGLGRVESAAPGGLSQANAEGNVPAVARLLFTRYVFAFEVTSALLITAAVGAMVLAHRERHEQRRSQRELAEARFKTMSPDKLPTMLPPPGVYARHNAVDTPALLPDGSPSERSVSRVLSARGDLRPVGPVADDVREIERAPSATDVRRTPGEQS
jgi:NADH-quinone oxidoreductase subunit J